jgi:hypothetical protein
MGTINNRLKKYNTNIKKLFDAIIKLNAEQQTKVMNYVEELLTDNKRMSVRKPCDIPINYATQNRVFSDTITDISKNGLFIETNQAINVGKKLCCHLICRDMIVHLKSKEKLPIQVDRALEWSSER